MFLNKLKEGVAFRGREKRWEWVGWKSEIQFKVKQSWELKKGRETINMFFSN